MKAWNVSRLLSGVPVLAMAVTILAVTRASATNSLDYDLPNQAGHFYTQTNGRGGQGGTGYAITNADGIPLWDVYRGLGGLDALGYPVSRRFTWDRFTVQAMQKVVFQWHPDSHQVAFVNVLDRMHDHIRTVVGRGKHDRIRRQIASRA